MAPALFQRTMEGLVSDIPMCKCCLDDIIITGRTDEEHITTLNLVLQRLWESGMRLMLIKCEFRKSSVTYLGHRLDAQGIRPVRNWKPLRKPLCPRIRRNCKLIVVCWGITDALYQYEQENYPFE